MWNGYIYGVGRVEQQYSFYPYISAVLIPHYPPLAAPSAPMQATSTFDSLHGLVAVVWSPAMDSDTTSSLLTYQVNVTTSTEFQEVDWRSVGKEFSASLPVTFGNDYTIGIRAIDDLGNVGTPLIISWHFPEGYSVAPEQLVHTATLTGGDGNSQKIRITATTTVRGISLWTAGQFGAWCCSDSVISIHSDRDGVTGDSLATSTTVRAGPAEGDHERLYAFDPPLLLSPGLYWFELDNALGHNDTTVFGSDHDTYGDGEWSAAPQEDAYFRIQQSDGP
jgi:hypothetical protein